MGTRSFSPYVRWLQMGLQTAVYGAIFISLCTVALCMQTSMELQLPFNSVPFYVLVFSATLGQYNIHYYIKKSARAHSDRFAWSQAHRQVHVWLNVVGAIGVMYGLLHLQLKHYLVLGIIAAITVLYSFPFLPFTHKRRLKDYGLLKILTLSYVWVLITVWFPVVTKMKVTPDFMSVFLERFLLLFVLCLAFDIRDMEADRSEGIGTIPVACGSNRSYQIIWLGLVLMVLTGLWRLDQTHNFLQFNAIVISAIATYFMVEHSRKHPSDMVYLLGIDGMMLLQAVLVAVASI